MKLQMGTVENQNKKYSTTGGKSGYLIMNAIITIFLSKVNLSSIQFFMHPREQYDIFTIPLLFAVLAKQDKCIVVSFGVMK